MPSLVGQDAGQAEVVSRSEGTSQGDALAVGGLGFAEVTEVAQGLPQGEQGPGHVHAAVAVDRPTPLDGASEEGHSVGRAALLVEYEAHVAQQQGGIGADRSRSLFHDGQCLSKQSLRLLRVAASQGDLAQVVQRLTGEWMVWRRCGVSRIGSRCSGGIDGAGGCKGVAGGVASECAVPEPRTRGTGVVAGRVIRIEVSGLAAGVYLYRLVVQASGGKSQQYRGQLVVAH